MCTLSEKIQKLAPRIGLVHPKIDISKKSVFVLDVGVVIQFAAELKIEAKEIKEKIYTKSGMTLALIPFRGTNTEAQLIEVSPYRAIQLYDSPKKRDSTRIIVSEDRIRIFSSQADIIYRIIDFLLEFLPKFRRPPNYARINFQNKPVPSKSAMRDFKKLQTLRYPIPTFTVE